LGVSQTSQAEGNAKARGSHKKTEAYSLFVCSGIFGMLIFETSGSREEIRMILTDDYGRPLPTGTVLDLQPYSPHTVIVGYNEWGQQVVGHNSKQQGRAVISWPEEFNDLGRIPFRVVRYPLSFHEGGRIWQSVLRDVERGVRWLPEDNCQDLVSRAVTGRDGSPTRDAILGFGFFGALIWLASTV
jgi:hypothetical protein